MSILKTKQILIAILFSLPFLSALGQQTVVDTAFIYPAEIVDIKPIFKGGESTMWQVVGQNIRFPIDARQRVGNIGSAYISFVVDENGQLDSSSIKFVLYLIESTNKKVKTQRIVQETKLDNVQLQCMYEAKRVVGLLKNWTPAQAEGKPVKCRKTLPIGFKNEGVMYRN